MEEIVLNPQVLGGKAVIRGTRIPVQFILELLSAGMEVARAIALGDYGLRSVILRSDSDEESR